MVLQNLLTFCCDICGERKQQYLAKAVETELASFLNFEKASLLNYEDGKLFTIKRIINDTGMLLVNGFNELPIALGLTVKALAEKRTIISNL